MTSPSDPNPPDGPQYRAADDPTVPTGASQLIDLLAQARDEGFDAQFVPQDSGEVRCASCHRSVASGDLLVVSQRRLEGASDAADMMLLVSAHCPECKRGGTLTLGYGPAAAEADVAVLGGLDI